jgi:hypothetical protein
MNPSSSTPGGPPRRGGTCVPLSTPLRRHATPAPCVHAGTARLALGLLLAALLAPAHAEVRLERTFLPHDASPSSFAVGLPGGTNFCFDPVRGGVSYVWRGGFLDLTSVRPGPGKFINAARLLGPIVYQESGHAPLRRGDPGRAPVVEFTGYTLHDAAIEFRYTVDGFPVREEIRARPGGGLLRRFRLAAGTDARWWHVVAGRPPRELPRAADGTLQLELELPQPHP